MNKSLILALLANLPGGVGPMRSASAAKSASCDGSARAIDVCSGGCVARQ